jgi:hypothetical protein
MKAEGYKLVDIGKSCVYQPCDPSEATHVKLHAPGPYPNRMLPIGDADGWGWNRDTEKPTITPSILTDGGDGRPRCHSYVTNGKIQFLHDCTHELAGRTLDLLDIE